MTLKMQKTFNQSAAAIAAVGAIWTRHLRRASSTGYNDQRGASFRSHLFCFESFIKDFEKLNIEEAK